MTTVTRDNGVLVLDIRGVLTRADLDRAEQEVLDAMRRDGVRTVRLLVRLHDFDGWAPDPRWHDLSFYVRHGDALDRIAIVGDPRWRGEALMFAAADLRKGPVEFFAPAQETEAREWLTR